MKGRRDHKALQEIPASRGPLETPVNPVTQANRDNLATPENRERQDPRDRKER